MANEITIKVKISGPTKTDFDKSRATAKTFGEQIDEDLKASGDKAGKSMGQGVGSSLNNELKALKLPEIDVKAKADDAIAKLDEARHAAEELGKDDPTVEVKVRTEKAIAEIDKLKAKLISVGEEAGGPAGQSFAKKFKGSFEGIGDAILPGLIGTGTALLPLLGASIAGAIVGGVGLGGIAGGFALAARDESVQFAMLDLQDSLSDHLTKGIEPFIPVAVASIKQVSTALNGVDFKGIFADLAPQVAPVINGVTDLITRLGGAIANVVKNSGPVLAEIGQEIGDIGTTIANGLNNLSDNSGQEAQALKDLFSIINGGIATAFAFVNVLTEMYGAFHKLFELSLPGLYEDINDWQRTVTSSATGMAEAYIANSKAEQQTATSTEQATEAFKAQDDAIHAVADSLKAATDPAFAFIDAQSQLNDAQTAYNKAVKKGGENSGEAKKAQTELQKAMVGYVSAAASATNGTGHLTSEQKNLLKSAGQSKKQINDLDTALYNAWKQANKLDGFEVDVTYKTTFKTYGRPISGAIDPSTFYHGLAHGGVKGAATGATSSGLTWTGEQGPELLDLPPGTSVKTAGDSARAAASMPDAMGWNGAPIVLQLVVDGRVLAEQTVGPLTDLVRTKGRGSVQKLLGQPGVRA